MMDTHSGFAFFGTFEVLTANQIARINLTDFTFVDALVIPGVSLCDMSDN